MSSESIWNLLPSNIDRPSIDNDPFWNKYSRTHLNAKIHVAILSQPYLNLILDAKKTIESRFSSDRRSPYQRVSEGDIVLLKQVGGPINGIAVASKIWYYQVTSKVFWSIKCNFADRLQIEDLELWEKYKKASYATLIELGNVTRLDPIKYIKRDQRAWVTFSKEASQLSLPLS